MTFKRVLTQPCLACNREAFTEMCQLCAELEDAEERASEQGEGEANYADKTTA